MNPINAYAALQAKQSLQPFQIQRREPKPHDVVIEILYCGVCHSDVHKVKDEWGNSIYPLVPGHEIVGKVSRVGTSVSRYKIGDHVGVGCFVDSCRQCPACKTGTEQYCDKNMTQTYNAIDRDGALTQGGYSTQIVVDENYVVKIPANLPLDKAAPLLCAGITTYSPLRHWQVKPGDKVAIIGLGGLGHMGVKLAKAMGAEVTVLSTSQKKSSDAYDLGAKNFTNTSDAKTFSDYAGYFNIILNTVSSNIELDKYLGLLKLDGTLVLLGAPEKPYTISPFSLIWRRRQLAGSLIGGIKETQEMLDFCSKHNITSDIELIPMQKINEAYERMVKGDVRYRFVIDINSLRS